MKTTCLIVDDEPLAIKVIQSHLAQLDDLEVVGTCRHATEAFEFLQKQRVDLLFLDIQMPKLTGIELAEALDAGTRVIFTTAHREYAVKGFEVDAVDYLLKPISLSRLLRAVGKYRRLQGGEGASAGKAGSSSYDLHLNVRVDRRVEKILLSELLYVESLSDYVSIHTLSRTLVTKQRISRLEDRLTTHGFIRIHRSYLVSMAKITGFSSEEVQVGGQCLPIGGTYRQAVLAALNYHDTV